MFSSSSPLLCLRRLVAVALFGAVALVAGRAATLAFDTTIHIQPAPDSPVVGNVPAGTSITPLLREELTSARLESPPPGWIAIRSPGPFTGFVRNSDVEDGRVRPGAEVRLQPLPNAPLLLVVEEGDDATASEPLGDWSRATIRTDLYVYVNALPPASRRQAADVVSPPSPAADDSNAMLDPSPSSQDESVRPERPQKPQRTREPKVEPAPVETEGAPRTFSGYLVRTRRFLGRGPKYDYQLVDENNRRIALLDVSSLLAMSPIESFENRHVSVYGPGLTRPDVKDVIIRVQTMRLDR